MTVKLTTNDKQTDFVRRLSTGMPGVLDRLSDLKITNSSDRHAAVVPTTLGVTIVAFRGPEKMGYPRKKKTTHLEAGSYDGIMA